MKIHHHLQRIGRHVKFFIDKGCDQTTIQQKVNDYLSKYPDIIVHGIKFSARPSNPASNNTWQIWSVMVDYEVVEDAKRKHNRQVEFFMDKGCDEGGIQEKVNDFFSQHPDIIVHDIKFSARPSNPVSNNTWQIWSVMVDYEVEAQETPTEAID